MHSHTFQKAMPVAVLILAISTATYAQTPIWGLQPGDSFRVQTIIERQNTIRLDEAKESIRKTTDTITFEYRVLRLLPGGNLSIQIRVIQANRKTGDDDALDKAATQQLPGLNKIAVIATVDPDGVFQDLAEYDGAINQLLETHPSGRQLMDQSVSKKVFTSWISTPFWLPAPGTKGATAQHNHNISLGLLGQLEITTTCKTEPSEQLFAKATISSDSQHVPPTTAGRKPTDATVVFTNVNAQIDLFRGQGTVAVPAKESDNIADPVDEPDSATPAKRPVFEALTLDVAYSGEATLQIADSQRTLRFRQQQTVSSRLLPGHRIGQRSRYPLFIRP